MGIVNSFMKITFCSWDGLLIQYLVERVDIQL